jgi:hypothetical protein
MERMAVLVEDEPVGSPATDIPVAVVYYEWRGGLPRAQASIPPGHRMGKYRIVYLGYHQIVAEFVMKSQVNRCQRIRVHIREPPNLFARNWMVSDLLSVHLPERGYPHKVLPMPDVRSAS